MCTLTQTCMHEWQLFPVNLPTLPPLERVARGNDAMTQAPAPARASSGPNCLARHKVGPGVPPTLAVARVSKRRLLYVHERSQGVLRDFPIRRAGRPAYAGPSNTPRVVDAQAAAPRKRSVERSDEGQGRAPARPPPSASLKATSRQCVTNSAPIARKAGACGLLPLLRTT